MPGQSSISPLQGLRQVSQLKGAIMPSTIASKLWAGISVLSYSYLIKPTLLRIPEDFVHLAFQRNTRVRLAKPANRPAAARGDREPPQTLSEHRHSTLRAELSLLDREVARHFLYPEELALRGSRTRRG
jgi:hypothetical protein